MTEENSSGMEKLEKDITAVWLINTQQMYEERILGHRGCCLAAQSCPTLGDSMDCSTPIFAILHYLPEFAQTHVH